MRSWIMKWTMRQPCSAHSCFASMPRYAVSCGRKCPVAAWKTTKMPEPMSPRAISLKSARPSPTSVSTNPSSCMAESDDTGCSDVERGSGVLAQPSPSADTSCRFPSRQRRAAAWAMESCSSIQREDHVLVSDPPPHSTCQLGYSRDRYAQQRRRVLPREPRIPPAAFPRDGRVLELRDLVLDHLHPHRRRAVVWLRTEVRRADHQLRRLAAGEPLHARGRGVDGGDRVGLPH